MNPHVEVFATVTNPQGEKTAVPVGSFPVEFLPLPADWKKSRKAVALAEVGHYPSWRDGWRVSFAYDLAAAF